MNLSIKKVSHGRGSTSHGSGGARRHECAHVCGPYRYDHGHVHAYLNRDNTLFLLQSSTL